VRRFFPTTLLAGLLVVSFNLTTASAFTYIPYGPNMYGYCQTLGYTGVTLDGTTAYDWHCSRPGTKAAFNFDALCRWQFSSYISQHRRFGSAAVGRFTSFYNAYTWECEQTTYRLGVLNTAAQMNRFCATRQPGAWASLYDQKGPPYNAGSWWCLYYDNAHTLRGWPFGNTDQMDTPNGGVCSTLFPNRNPTPGGRVGNWYDPYSWECWT
jgi:hypothetical protein